MNNENLSIEELRGKIDAIDTELVKLFAERMEVSSGVAEYKRQRGLPVLDAGRERSLLAKVSEMAGEDFASYVRALYSTIFSLSRSYQQKLISGTTDSVVRIDEAIKNTNPLFPPSAVVACQGIEGAYSQIAAQKMFELPDIQYYTSFGEVFDAIESGKCRYGVLPLENSTAGSVTKIYDLMNKHQFYIVKSWRLKIDHNLLAKPGVKLEEIREVYSHEQAINQCAAFLRENPQIKVVECANTAMAARFAASSDRRDVAALSSRDCAETYGLNNLVPNVQDNANNYTRFICISRELEIYPGADKTSIMTVAPNKPGALYSLLSLFYAEGVNLTKLESRPIPERDFEFLFYFDVDVSVYSPKLAAVIGELEKQSDRFRYLGSYSERIG